MKLIYAVLLDGNAYPPGATDTTRVSATAGYIETEAHGWMQKNYPQVAFETKRISSSDTGAAHHQVLADSPEEKEQGERILDQLANFIHNRISRPDVD